MDLLLYCYVQGHTVSIKFTFLSDFFLSYILLCLIFKLSVIEKKPNMPTPLLEGRQISLLCCCLLCVMCFFVSFLEVEVVLCCVNHPGKVRNWSWENVAVNLAGLPKVGNTGYYYSQP